MASHVSDYFDSASEFYDAQTSTPEDWYTPIHLRETITRDRKRYREALVIGVGTGHDLDVLMDTDIASISMIDISPRMLDIAISRYPSAHPHLGDFTFHRFDHHFDLIVCCGVLEFVEDLDHFMLKCAEVLTPGGSIYLTYEPQIHNYAPQKMETQIVGEHDDGTNRTSGVRVYRRDMGRFLSAVSSANLTIREYFEHLAYSLDGDIFYHFAVLEKD